MEEILSKLLVSNSQVIQQGTRELKEAFKKPESIPALCDIIMSSSNLQIRQTAAVILRRKLGRKRQWYKLNLDTRNKVKQAMLQALINEQAKLVKNCIAQFIGILGKHELLDNTWPEVLQLIHTLCNSNNNFDCELGMYTLSVMTEMSQDSYLIHADSFAALFTNALYKIFDLNSNLAYYTIITMKNLVPLIGNQQQMVNVYHNLLPRVLEIISKWAETEDDKRTCEIFEILEELIEYVIVVVVPHVRIIVETCLRIGSNNLMHTSVQIKAISVIGWIIRCKSKVIQKHKLVEPIIDVLIKLMAQQPADDVNEEYFLNDPDQLTSITIATQTLDLIALNIPSEKVVPYILTIVEPAIHGNDIYAQKASYLAIAILSEGCSECVRTKYLESFLKCVCNAIHNPNAVVRNAAFFALGQFSEHLQPEISIYAAELLPILFQYLEELFMQMEKEKVEPSSLDRLFYALETFCENLDEALMPYLPTLMDRLFFALDPSGWSLQLKRIALSTLGSVASAVKDGLLPYFQKIVVILNSYINCDYNSPIHQLQSYAIESLAVVAQFIGEENFKPLSFDSLKFGLEILDNSDDPDVRKSIYALFAALSIVMKDEINTALPKIVSEMIKSIQSSEGIVTHYEEEDKEDLEVYSILSDEDDELEEDIELSSSSSDDSGQCRYSVENSYNEEKEQACLALKEICVNTGVAFLPYIETCFEEIFKLINYPQDDIRKISIDALLQFCIALHKINTKETKVALYKALQMFIPKCSELIRSDEERSVVMSCLDAYAALLDEIKCDAIVGDGHREAIMNSVIDVLTLKTMCQDNDIGNSVDNEEDAEAEQDELLLESAGDIIPKFAAIIPSDDFVLYFPNILQLLTLRTKKQNRLSQRSFAFGTLAECMKSLDIYVQKFIPHLLQLWFMGTKDIADEVRNNAFFGLGEMILHGKDKIYPYYQEILEAISIAISKESHAGTLDNICGALAKIIIVNPDCIPLEQIFPIFLKNLPLRDDFQENEAIIKCMFSLYQQGNEILRQNLSAVVKIMVHIYQNNQTQNDEIKDLLIKFIKQINADFSQEFASTVSCLGSETTKTLQNLFILK